MAETTRSPFRRPETTQSPFEEPESQDPFEGRKPELKTKEELPAVELTEAGKGLRAATLGLQGGIQRGVAAVANLTGDEESERAHLEQGDRLSRLASKFPADVASLSEVEDLGDLGQFLAYGGPAVIPSIVLAGAGAVAGGAVGGVPGAVAGGLKGAALRTAAGQGLRAAGKSLVTAGVRRGAQLGGISAVGLPEAGQVYGDILEETGEKRPIQALVTGAGIGSLEALALGKALARLAPSKAAKALKGDTSALAHVSGAAASQALTEGVTEAAQEAMSTLSVKMASGDPLDEQDFIQLMDAATIGAFAGMIMGGTGGATSYMLNKAKTDIDAFQHAMDTETPDAAAQFDTAPDFISELINPEAAAEVSAFEVSDLLKQIRSGQVTGQGFQTADSLSPGNGLELVRRLDVMYAQAEEQSITGQEPVSVPDDTTGGVTEDIDLGEEELFADSVVGDERAPFDTREVAPTTVEHLLDNRGIPYAPAAEGVDRLAERITNLNRTDPTFTGQLAELERERRDLDAAGLKADAGRISDEQLELVRDPPFRRVKLEDYLHREGMRATDGSPNAVRTHMLEKAQGLLERTRKFNPEGVDTRGVHQFMRDFEVIEKRMTSDIVGRSDLAGYNVDELTPQYTGTEKEVRADLNLAKRTASPEDAATIDTQLKEMEHARNMRSVLRRPPKEGLREDEMQVKITDLGKLVVLQKQMEIAKELGDATQLEKLQGQFRKEKEGRLWNVALTNATHKGFRQLQERGFEEQRTGVTVQRARAALFNSLASIMSMPGQKVQITQKPKRGSLAFAAGKRRLTFGEVMAGTPRKRAQMAAKYVKDQRDTLRNEQSEWLRRAERAESRLDESEFTTKARLLEGAINNAEDKLRGLEEAARKETTSEDIEAWNAAALFKTIQGTEFAGATPGAILELAKTKRVPNNVANAAKKLWATRERRHAAQEKEVTRENEDRWENVEQEGRENLEVQYQPLDSPRVDQRGMFVGKEDPFRLRRSGFDSENRQWTAIQRASNRYFTTREDLKGFQNLSGNTANEDRSTTITRLNDLRAHADAVRLRMRSLESKRETQNGLTGESSAERLAQLRTALSLSKQNPGRTKEQWSLQAKSIRLPITPAKNHLLQAYRHLASQTPQQLNDVLKHVETNAQVHTSVDKELVGLQEELGTLTARIERDESVLEAFQLGPAQERLFRLDYELATTEEFTGEYSKEMAEAWYLDQMTQARTAMDKALAANKWDSNRSKRHYLKQAWKGQFESIKDGTKTAITAPATTTTKSWRPGDTITIQGGNNQQMRVEVFAAESFFPSQLSEERLADWKRNNAAQEIPFPDGTELVQAFVSPLEDDVSFQGAKPGGGLYTLDEYTQQEKDNSAQQEEARTIMETWLNAMGLNEKTRMVDTAEAMSHLARANQGQTTIGWMLQGHVNGLTIRVRNALGQATGEQVVWINPYLDRRYLELTVGHETGHVIIRRTWEEMDPAQASRLKREFDQYVETVDKGLLKRISPLLRVQLKVAPKEVFGFLVDSMLRNSQSMDPAHNFSASDLEYLKNFEEYFADRILGWMVNPRKPTRGDTKARWFKKIALKLRDVWEDAQAGSPSPLQYAEIETWLDDMLGRSSGHWDSPMDVWTAIATMNASHGTGINANPSLWQRNRNVIPQADEVRVAVAKLGGINIQEAIDNGLLDGREDIHAQEYGFAMLRVFTNDGLSIKQMETELGKLGYKATNGSRVETLFASLEGQDQFSRHYSEDAAHDWSVRETGFEAPPTAEALEEAGFNELNEEQQAYVEGEFLKRAEESENVERRPDEGITLEGKATTNDQTRARAGQQGAEGPTAESEGAAGKETPRVLPQEVVNDLRRLFKELVGHDITQVPGDKTQFGGMEDPAERLAWLAMMSQEDARGAVFNQAIRSSMELLFSKAERQFLGNVANRPHIRRQLLDLVRGDNRAMMEVASDPVARIGYMYQFWNDGRLDLQAPRGNGIFQKLADFFRRAFSVIAEHNKAEQLFTHFTDGIKKSRRHTGGGTFVVERKSSNERVDTVLRGAQQAWHSARYATNLVLGSLTSRFRNTNNPFIHQILDMVYTPVGTEGVQEDMFSARARKRGRFNNMAADIYEGLTEEQGREAAEILNNPDKWNVTGDGQVTVEGAGVEVMEAVKRTWGFMRHMRDYAVESGLDIGDRGQRYFPWSFDIDHMLTNADRFMELLNRPEYTEVVDSIAKEYKKTREEAIRYIFESITNTGGYADINLDPDSVTNQPGFGSINERTLAWITEKGSPESIEIFSEFLSKDLGLTLSNYIDQIVKRSEYHKRFGNGEIERLVSQAVRFGATDRDVDTVRAGMDAIMGTAGYNTNLWLHKVLDLQPPPPGQPVSPALQRLQGAIMVYQNVRVLSMATLTSLADVAGLVVRSGDFSIAASAFRTGLREAVNASRGNPSVLNSLAETLGIVDRHMTVEALNWEYGGIYITGKARKINETFFKAIGLQWWTKTTRIMGLHGGLKFLERHTKNPNDHSTRYLSELGLTKEDVRFDGEGNVLNLTHSERERLRQSSAAEAKAELARDDRVQAALHRFVDGAILRPNAAQRPIWASDPHFMLIFHLKSFMYSFHERILKRVANEAREQQSVWPILQLGSYIPIMIGADMLRELITEPLEFDDEKKEWGVSEWIRHAGRRAGLLGKYEMALDAKEDVQYGSPLSSFMGPTWETFTKRIPRAFQGSAEDTVRLLPGQNLITPWVY